MTMATLERAVLAELHTEAADKEALSGLDYGIKLVHELEKMARWLLRWYPSAARPADSTTLGECVDGAEFALAWLDYYRARAAEDPLAPFQKDFNRDPSEGELLRLVAQQATRIAERIDLIVKHAGIETPPIVLTGQRRAAHLHGAVQQRYGT
jgi:hypothetical protein